MAYDDKKVLMGREPVILVEIDFNACSLTYGSSPCTASGAAGTECFNSFSTCQDQANFAASTKTVRFSSVRLDGLGLCFPTITGVSTSPTVLTPGKGLGVRSKVSIQLTDHPWTDVGFDNYLANRTYDADSQGSFWGKMINRWPFYENNEVRVKTGYLADDGTYDANNFITRTYFIETITGPSDNGMVKIVAKDILKFADREKANLPVQSQATLDADITAGALSFDITDPNDDIKDAYDDSTNVAAGQTYIRIDDEVMLVTNLTGTSGNYTLTVTRASIPSVYTGSLTAETHDEDASVQHCYNFSDLEPDNIVQYLLETVAGVNSSFLDLTGWQANIDFGLQNYLFSALITEPTPVNKLLDEIVQHNIFIWWDERDQKVKMDSILKKPVDYGPFTDESNLVKGSVSVARDDKNRVSQAWFAFGLRTPVAEMDELKNYSAVKVTANLAAEGANEYNQSRVKRFFSRWLPLSKSSVASEITNRYVNYYLNTKAVISVELDAKDDDAWTGDRVVVETRQMQDRFGAAASKNYRILQASEVFKSGSPSYKYVMQSTGGFFDGSDTATYGLITPDINPEDGVSAFPDYSSDSTALKSKYAFICEDDRGDGNPGFSPNEEPYLII